MTTIFGFTVSNNSFYYIDTNGVLNTIDLKAYSVLCKLFLHWNELKLFSKGVIVEEDLIFAPWVTINEPIGILKISLCNNTKTMIYLKGSRYNHKMSLFNDIIELDNHLFFIPFQYSDLVELDVQKNDLMYYGDLIDKTLPKNINNNDMYLFRHASIWKGNVLVMPFFRYNRVLLFETNSKVISYVDVQENSCGFADVCVNEDSLVLIEANTGRILVYSLREKKTIRIIELEKGVGEFYFNLIDCGNCYYVLQRFALKSYKIDKETYMIEELDLGKIEGINHINVLCAQRDENIVYMSLRDAQDVIGMIDIEKDETIWIRIPQMNTGELYSKIQTREIIYEDANSKLMGYIEEMHY